MEPEEYKIMFELEEKHWWYKGLHDLFLSTIQKITGGERNLKILDAGCGTGFLLKQLAEYGTAFGVDFSGIALGYCRKRGLERVKKASLLQLPFPDDFFDVITSADVLSHSGVKDDVRAIKEIYRTLKPEGTLILNLPAYERLRSAHDKQVHTGHRYTKDELRSKLKENNFRTIKITYRNTFLFLPSLLFKYIRKKLGRRDSSDLKMLPEIINAPLYILLKIENALLRLIDMPFGVSLFSVSKK